MPRGWVAGAAGLLALGWSAALFLRVATFDNGLTWNGRDVILWGWLGVFQGQLGWWANLVFLDAMMRFGGLWTLSRRRARLRLMVLVPLLVNAAFWRAVPRDESSFAAMPILSWGPGYWLWFGVQLAALALLWHRSRKQDRE